MPAHQAPGPNSHSRRRFLVLGGMGAVTAGAWAVAWRARSGESHSAAPTVKVNEPAPPTPPTLAGAAPAPPASQVFDTVIKGGRVMDPDSGFDHVADVGIIGDRIASISLEPLTGTTTIDATGKVVAPGFIDVLSYEPNSFGVWYKLGDGVTTNLGMHGIKDPVQADSYFSRYGSGHGEPIHYGGAFSDQWFRNSVGIGSVAASSSQLSRLEDDLNSQIDKGWIGVAVDPEYTPYVDFNEFVGMGTVAKRTGMPLFTHIRYSSPEPPGQTSLDALDEALRVAEQTGVKLHIDHIPSMCTHVMPEAVAKINDARAKGLDVTGCFYPYTFWGTYLASARFSGDWQSRFRITYHDLQLAGSSERLTEASFQKYKAQNKLVVAYAIPQEDVNTCLAADWAMIGSDAIPESSRNNHPRGAGCFSRLVGPYVRDMKLLSLMDALRKCTILPARAVEGRVPTMQKKGRMQIGADADITVFDPNTIADTSTVENPASLSAGIDHVLVMGKVALDPSGPKRDVFAGQPVKGQPA